MLVEYEPFEEVLRVSTSRSTIAKVGRTSKINNDSAALDALMDKIGELVMSIEATKKKTLKEQLTKGLFYIRKRTLHKNLVELFYIRKPSLRKNVVELFYISREIYSDEDMDMAIERLHIIKNLVELFYIGSQIFTKDG